MLTLRVLPTATNSGSWLNETAKKKPQKNQTRPASKQALLNKKYSFSNALFIVRTTKTAKNDCWWFYAPTREYYTYIETSP